MPRKMSVELYLNSIIESWPDIVQYFLMSNTLEIDAETNAMEGYLFKRGKTLGVWKARYYVLQQGVLRYSEMVSMALLKGLSPGIFFSFERLINRKIWSFSEDWI
jgi:hypothetical protein